MSASAQTPPIRKGLVTTIIPVFNRRKMVKEAVASVLAQTYQSLQIIVVDDGSTDETAASVRRLAKKYSVVTALRQENKGPGAARQLGLEHAEGEYIQFLDSDDLLLPAKFSLQVAALKADKSAVAAYGKTECIYKDNEPRQVAWKRTEEKHETMFPLFLRERWWGTSTPLYRHEALRKIGAILPISYEEDWEYDCRLAARGGKLAFVNDFVSRQRQQDDNLSRGGSMVKEKLRDRCVAREAMFVSAKKSRVKLSQDDFEFFSRSVFLLARECAAAGLKKEVKQMLRLSITANKGPTREHEMFIKFGNFFGWRAAGLTAKGWQRIKPQA
jgi:glycosyltransferase involved in cell wall biosynthesis